MLPLLYYHYHCTAIIILPVYYDSTIPLYYLGLNTNQSSKEGFATVLLQYKYIIFY